MKRGFEIVTKYQNQGLTVPSRQTKHAAGYDFCAAEDFVLPSIWKLNFLKILHRLRKNKEYTDEDMLNAQKELKPLLVPTGIKAYMQDDEFLMLANRSSSSLKRNMIIPNGVGIIDADYYGNDKNEGEIFVQMLNFGLKDQLIRKGERICQGIFIQYLKADDEKKPKMTRQGGFGSSGVK